MPALLLAINVSAVNRVADNYGKKTSKYILLGPFQVSGLSSYKAVIRKEEEVNQFQQEQGEHIAESLRKNGIEAALVACRKQEHSTAESDSDIEFMVSILL